MQDLLDLDRYPIDRLDSPPGVRLIERCKATLEQNVALRTLELSADEEKLIRGEEESFSQ